MTVNRQTIQVTYPHEADVISVHKPYLHVSFPIIGFNRTVWTFDKYDTVYVTCAKRLCESNLDESSNSTLKDLYRCFNNYYNHLAASFPGQPG